MQIARPKWIIVAVLLLCSSVSFAGLIGGSFVTISATNSQGSGSWSQAIPEGWSFPASGIFDWSLPSSVEIWGSGNKLATIDAVGLQFHEDPAVILNFTATAGAVDTVITVTSATVAFPTITFPDAFATAALTLTDGDNSGGSAVTGLLTGAKAYRATYNGSTDWAYLVGSFVGPIDSSALNTERRPPVSGREAIATPIFSLSSQFNFLLSATDSVSGTSRFDVIPEPTALGFLLFGTLLIPRRRAR